MISARIFIVCATFSFLSACTPGPSVVELNVTNNLDIARKGETIELDLKQIPKLLLVFSPEQIRIREGESDRIVKSQLIDLDGDKKPDQLIFQSDFIAKEQKHFHIEGAEEKLELRPSFKYEVLKSEDSFRKFIAVWESFIEDANIFNSK